MLVGFFGLFFIFCYGRTVVFSFFGKGIVWEVVRREVGLVVVDNSEKGSYLYGFEDIEF